MRDLSLGLKNDLVHKLILSLQAISLNGDTPGPVRMAVETVLKEWFNLISDEPACVTESINFFQSREYQLWMNMFNSVLNKSYSHQLLTHCVQRQFMDQVD